MELIGIIATIILVVSMVSNCRTKNSLIIMRTLNAIASVLFIIYGCLILAYSTILSNIAILIIDLFYVYKIVKSND